MKDSLAVTLGNCVSFCGFAFGVLVVGPLYGVVWLAFKASRWALFHALALVLWALLTKRIAALSLLADDRELP